MPKSLFYLLLIALIVLLGSDALDAQTFAPTDLTNADAMLKRVYNKIFERSGIFVDIACFIGAMGAIIMISSHIYERMLRGKSIFLSEVARPLVILVALVLYTPLIQTINLVLSPTLVATKELVNGERDVLENVIDQMEANDVKSGQHEAYGTAFGSDGDFDRYLEIYELEDDAGTMGINRIGQFLSWRMESYLYQIRWMIRMALFWVLGFLYTAVVFCLSTVRTFTLSVLALVGPLALGFSLWSPFSRSFITWLGRYIAVYLWLPVANIFGFLITTVMTEFNLIHMTNAAAGGSNVAFSSLDIMYAVMLVTGIVGYIAVPSITAYVITASGASSLLSGAAGAGKMAASAAGAAAGGAMGAIAGSSIFSTGNSNSSIVDSIKSDSSDSDGTSNVNNYPQLAGNRPER